jgi:hypothetical protein
MRTTPESGEHERIEPHDRLQDFPCLSSRFGYKPTCFMWRSLEATDQRQARPMPSVSLSPQTLSNRSDESDPRAAHCQYGTGNLKVPVLLLVPCGGSFVTCHPPRSIPFQGPSQFLQRNETAASSHSQIITFIVIISLAQCASYPVSSDATLFQPPSPGFGAAFW